MVGGDIRYAVTADGVNIAYETRGAGPDDLVFIPGFAACFDVELEEPHFARLIEAMAARWRVVLFDKRGPGLSDRQNTPDLEMRADDLRAVLDAVGSEAAILVGGGEGGALAAFFAATHPERVTALVPVDAWARIAWATDYPMGMTQEAYVADTEELAKGWGTQRKRGDLVSPRIADLDALGMVWDPYEEAWQQGLAAAREYRAEHGDLGIPRGYVTRDGFALGSWIKTRRAEKRKGKLAPERAARLEALPGWEW